VVLITGDLTDNGARKEFSKAKQLFHKLEKSLPNARYVLMKTCVIHHTSGVETCDL